MINSMLSALCEKKQLPASAFFQGLSYYHDWACIYKTLIHKALDAESNRYSKFKIGYKWLRTFYYLVYDNYGKTLRTNEYLNLKDHYEYVKTLLDSRKESI